MKYNHLARDHGGYIYIHQKTQIILFICLLSLRNDPGYTFSLISPTISTLLP